MGQARVKPLFQHDTNPTQQKLPPLVRKWAKWQFCFVKNIVYLLKWFLFFLWFFIYNFQRQENPLLREHHSPLQRCVWPHVKSTWTHTPCEGANGALGVGDLPPFLINLLVWEHSVNSIFIFYFFIFFLIKIPRENSYFYYHFLVFSETREGRQSCCFSLSLLLTCSTPSPSLPLFRFPSLLRPLPLSHVSLSLMLISLSLLLPWTSPPSHASLSSPSPPFPFNATPLLFSYDSINPSQAYQWRPSPSLLLVQNVCPRNSFRFFPSINTLQRPITRGTNPKRESTRKKGETPASFYRSISKRR